MNDLKHKRAIRAAERERTRRKNQKAHEQISQERKCFWTWPWGHIWGPTTVTSVCTKRCQVCGKVSSWDCTW